MNEKELKTSSKQRVVIVIVTILMLVSIIAGYAAIIANGSSSMNSGTNNQIDPELIAKYGEEYEALKNEFVELASSDFDEFIEYKSEIKGYNENTANSDGLKTRDLKIGTGKELKDGDTDYLAYYVGWCADESIFDSSFDNHEDPKAFTKILDASLGMIEGWNTGVQGMNIGGIREVTIPGELAYGDSMEICGGKNKPLKFMIMTKEKTGKLAELAADLDEAFMRYQYAQYGIDYDSVRQNTE